jgi:hypothetical protein
MSASGMQDDEGQKRTLRRFDFSLTFMLKVVDTALGTISQKIRNMTPRQLTVLISHCATATETETETATTTTTITTIAENEQRH